MMLNNKKSSRLGFLVGLAALFGRRIKPTVEDTRKLEFKTSTQRMGVSFTYKIRQIFRSRWIKTYPNTLSETKQSESGDTAVKK